MASETMTAEELIDAVSGGVAERVSGQLDELSGRMDELEAGLQSVAGASAGRLQVEGLSQRLDDVQATLQAGTEIGSVIGEDVGSTIISLVGQLLGLVDEDSDGASDVVSAVDGLREEVQAVSDVLIHPAMTTNFADYTVLEVLLLLLVFGWFVDKWCKILGSGFYWLK